MNSLDVIFEALQWFETPTTCLTIKMSTSFMGRDMRFQIGCWSKWFIYVYDCRSLTHKCLMRYLVWDRLLLKMIFHKTYIYDLFWLPYGILRYVFSGNFLFEIIYHHRIHNFSLHEYYCYAFLGEILCQIFLCRCHRQMMLFPQPFWNSNCFT